MASVVNPLKTEELLISKKALGREKILFPLEVSHIPAFAGQLSVALA